MQNGETQLYFKFSWREWQEFSNDTEQFEIVSYQFWYIETD